MVLGFLLFLSSLGCHNYIRDRPLSPGMTQNEVAELWGNNARKEFFIEDGKRIDLWYYKFGLSNQMYTVVFVDGLLSACKSQYVGPVVIRKQKGLLW